MNNVIIFAFPESQFKIWLTGKEDILEAEDFCLAFFPTLVETLNDFIDGREIGKMIVIGPQTYIPQVSRKLAYEFPQVTVEEEAV